MDYLVIRTEETLKRVHLSEISFLIVESTAVSLTAYLLNELTKHKIDILFCDEKRMPVSMIHSLYGSHDTSLKFRKQVEWDSDIKKIVWSEIVRWKRSGQAAVLSKIGNDRFLLLQQYKDNVLPGDTTNREGHAAKVYFNALFGIQFSRSDENNINSALNYGYSILLSVVAREITSCGYATQLGIFHDNMFNPFNLASDLMEPFRPFIDYYVVVKEFSAFDSKIKMEIVDLLNSSVRLNGKSMIMINAIQVYVKSIFEALNERDVSEIKFPEYELQIYENDSVL